MKIDKQNNLSLKRATWGQLGSSVTAPGYTDEAGVTGKESGMPKVSYNPQEKIDAAKKGSGTKNDGTIDRTAYNKAEKYNF